MRLLLTLLSSGAYVCRSYVLVDLSSIFVTNSGDWWSSIIGTRCTLFGCTWNPTTNVYTTPGGVPLLLVPGKYVLTDNGGGGTVTLNFNTAIYGNATRVYIAPFSCWGYAGSTTASISFWSLGNGAATNPDVIVTLVGGVDYRDFVQNMYTNTLSPPAIAILDNGLYGNGQGLRLDRAVLYLPAIFATGISRFRIVDTGSFGVSRLGFYALTVGDPTTSLNCLVGYYCATPTQMQLCAAGSFGSTTVNTAATCNGLCTAGYYCPAGSVSATSIICPVGSYCPIGSGSPVLCTCASSCRIEGMSTNPTCSPIATYTPLQTRTISMRASRCSSVTRTMTVATSLSVSSSVSASALATTSGRVTPSSCYAAAGSYCSALNVALLCPAGTYGATTGLTSASCSGPCAGGYYGDKPGMTLPT